jgi:hypothetical protein
MQGVTGAGLFTRAAASWRPDGVLAAGGPDLPFLMHTTSRVLHAIADRPLVNIQSDNTYRL